METAAWVNFWQKIKYFQSHRAYETKVSFGLEVPNNAFPNPLEKVRKENWGRGISKWSGLFLVVALVCICSNLRKLKSDFSD